MSRAVESDDKALLSTTFLWGIETINVFVETPLLRATVHVHVRLHCTQLLSLSLSLSLPFLVANVTRLSRCFG